MEIFWLAVPRETLNTARHSVSAANHKFLGQLHVLSNHQYDKRNQKKRTKPQTVDGGDIETPSAYTAG